MKGTSAMDARWSGGERTALLVPLVATAIGGIPFVAPEAFASVVGYAGDPFIFRLGGAATVGYTVATLAALRDGRRAAYRHVLVAGFAFSALVILALGAEVFRGRAQPVAYALGATSVVTLAINAWLMRRALPGSGATAPSWVRTFITVATLAALFFGIAPLLPGVFTPLFGYDGTAAFTFRMAGAATAGYAAMGLAELRSSRWDELRIPLLMGFTFNGLSLIASVVELAAGRATLLAILIAVASLAFSAGFAMALRVAARVSDAPQHSRRSA